MSAHEVPGQTAIARNQAVCDAIVRVHDKMVAELDELVENLVAVVDLRQPYRDELQAVKAYVIDDVYPHAAAEEASLYPAAAEDPALRALVEVMTAEHQALRDALHELSSARSAATAVAKAGALAALFALHARKENTAILPALAARPGLDLEALHDAMHQAMEAAESDSQDVELDVRELPHGRRHQMIFGLLGRLNEGQALVITNDHDPQPLRYQLDALHPGQFSWTYLQSGPEAWRVAIRRQGA